MAVGTITQGSENYRLQMGVLVKENQDGEVERF